VFVPDRRPVHAKIALAMDVPAIPSARCDEREAHLDGTGTRPIRDGHLRPVIHTDDFSVEFQGLA